MPCVLLKRPVYSGVKDSHPQHINNKGRRQSRRGRRKYIAFMRVAPAADSTCAGSAYQAFFRAIRVVRGYKDKRLETTFEHPGRTTVFAYN